MRGAEILMEGLEVVLVRRVTLRKVPCHLLTFSFVINLVTTLCTVFVCVAALAILDRLDVVNVDSLAWWLSERQLPSGGLNGRPEKLEDVSPPSHVCAMHRGRGFYTIGH